MSILEAEQEHIFELFRTLNSKDRFQKSGTGIGLNTVQKLVKKPGGKIRITSEAGRELRSLLLSRNKAWIPSITAE